MQSTVSGYTGMPGSHKLLWASTWPPPDVTPKLPFLGQDNEHVLVGLFSISYLYLKAVRLHGKDGWALLSVSLTVVH